MDRRPILCTSQIAVDFKIVLFSTFLGPNGTRCARCHFRAQKSLDFRAHPFERALLWISPHPNPYVPPHITTGTLIVKIQWYHSLADLSFKRICKTGLKYIQYTVLAQTHSHCRCCSWEGRPPAMVVMEGEGSGQQAASAAGQRIPSWWVIPRTGKSLY